MTPTQPRAVGIHLRDLPPIAVGIPAQEWMWTTSVIALTGLKLPPSSGWIWGLKCSSIAGNRNQIVEEFLRRRGPAYLLFADADMDPPPSAAVQLLVDAQSHELPIVGATYTQRRPPYLLEVFRPGDLARSVARDAITEVEAVGFGFVLLARAVFEALDPPWFADPAEDVRFCQRARAAGFPVHVNSGLEVGHVGTTSITPEFATVWQDTPQGRQDLADFERTAETRAHGRRSPQ